MAHNDKTEKPTAKRKREARKKGQVAKSTDLNTAVVLVGGLIAVTFMGPAVVSGVAASMRSAFAQIARPDSITSGAGLNGLFHAALHTLLTTAAPIGGVCMALGLLGNVAQIGFRPSTTALKPDFKRLNPATGFKNIFGTRIGVELAKAIAKISVVGVVVAMALIPDLTNLGASVGTPPGDLGRLIASGAMGIATRAVAALVLIGIIDYVWQKRRHSKQLKMTKHEVKEEGKQYTSPPEVRAAMRRRQMQAARARMMAAVPQADVVVTNPTHYSVALAYDGSKPAPVVVAKGKDLVALQIRRIATENNVPIVPDPPLARSLHASVEVGHMVPAEVYAAVAQVLAFVYRMAGRRRAAQS
jgi:flagellar biosynthetic protein FlhB